MINTSDFGKDKKYPKKTPDPAEGGIPKEKKIEPVSEFISEGNPNTDKVIKETRESAAQAQDEAHGFPERDQNDQAQKDTHVDFYNDRHLVKEIQEAIEHKNYLPDTDKHVSVTVENRTVTLKGKVSSEEARRDIEDTAVSFVGYNRVSNFLEIESNRS